MTAPQERRDKFRGEELAVGLRKKGQHCWRFVFGDPTRTSIVALPNLSLAKWSLPKRASIIRIQSCVFHCSPVAVEVWRSPIYLPSRERRGGSGGQGGGQGEGGGSGGESDGETVVEGWWAG
jgi:hypothetical protein